MSVLATWQAAETANGPRVLIAEDQPHVLEALRLLLKGEGYQTELASSPASVLSAIERREFDVVLMDLNYTRDTTSGQEGLELVERLQRRDSTLPVVVMTAWGSIELAVEAVRRGARDFIQKPWENQRLLEVVREQVTRGRVQRIEQRDQARRRSERTQEIEEAREIQRGLLPRRIPQIPGMEVAASWQPARIVGGDYFDVLKFNGGTLGLAIGDVVGKGLPAALVMSNVQAAVKAVATAGLPPGELCARVNRLLCGNLSAGRFVTFFYGVVDAQRWTLTYANAGHVPPVLVRRDGFTARLRAGGAVLGEFPEWRYEQGTLPFAPGDRLALFTDGVTEARNAAGEEYGEARLTEFLRRHRGLRAEELRARLMEDVQRYCGSSFEDDATVLVVSVE